MAIDEMVDILGEGIANICYVINPEVVVLGGGIMAQEQFLKERVECAVKRYLVSSIRNIQKLYLQNIMHEGIFIYCKIFRLSIRQAEKALFYRQEQRVYD